MIRILHAARLESGNGKMLDLELLLNQVGGIFKPDEEKDVTLQAALLAQVCRPDYEKQWAAVQDRTVQKKIVTPGIIDRDTWTLTRLTKLVLDMKAEMGSMGKAMIRSGISFNK
jgi:hypothetical protein